MSLADAFQGYNEANLALTLVRPDSARDAVEAALTKIRDALHEVMAEAGDWQGNGPRLRSIDMDRRHLLLSLIAGAALPPAAAFDALSRLADRARTDQQLLAELPDLIEAYARTFATSRPAALGGQVRALVDDLAARLHGPLTPRDRRTLGQLTSDAAALAGHLAYLTDEQGAARSYLGLARETARDAGDDTRHALAVALTSSLYSNVSVGVARPSPIARRMLAEARALLPVDAPAHHHVWVLARTAEEAAAAGDATAALHALSQAEDRLGDLRAVDARGYWTDRGMFQGWDASRLDGYRGVALLRLERAAEAHGTLSMALGHQPLAYGRAAVLADLVTAYALLDEADQAIEIAHLALDESEDAGYQLGFERVRGARGALTRFAGHPDLADLDGRLSA